LVRSALVALVVLLLLAGLVLILFFQPLHQLAAAAVDITVLQVAAQVAVLAAAQVILD
jgi:hypothetical protein